ncbi:uncharacterized protein YJR142W [Ctenocephalides felis]|uniref:uncharacterized protein YJR142W n=1 Tax=Ctenocephalides felis TaxID=7515 RepID=UPI000E6E11A6|nr:uncharacterized protein YJR142W [Ctenocephalides felis]
MAAVEGNVSRLLKLAQKFNCFYLNGITKGDCYPFIVEGVQVGLVRPDVAQVLIKYDNVFIMQNSCIQLKSTFRNYRERTEVMDSVLRMMKLEGLFTTLKGWREERYEVKSCDQSLLEMDRSATCLFAIRNYGVDINGYVHHPVKGLCIWLQQRSDTKQTWPGKWDNMVGGGLSVGYGIRETAIKEAAEEASIPNSLASKIISAGCVSFLFESERGIFPNTEFVFDLELPVDFVPRNADGEVQAFELLTANDCYERLFSSDFKTTSCPVVIDFLIRHGVITPENESNFTEVMELLHVPLQTLYKSRFSAKLSQENGKVLSI